MGQLSLSFGPTAILFLLLWLRFIICVLPLLLLFLQLQICPLPLPIITLQCLFVYFQPGHTTTKRLSHKSSEIARSSKIWKKTSPFQLRFWSRHCVTWLWSGEGVLCQNILQRIFLKSGLRCVLCPVIAFCVF